MELKAGYKQTEIGVIPEDWSLVQLKECCNKITDGTHDTPQQVKNGIPFLTAIHVKENGIDYENCSFLSKNDHELIFKRCNPQYGDVLLVNIGAGVATTAVVLVDYEFSLKNVALLKPNPSKLIGTYLNYCLNFQKEKIVQSLLSGGAQPFLSLAQIGNINIPLASVEEQRAIATTLSNVDTLLTKLDTLIAKKRDLKQAAMQQLLTAQTRLPGFSGEWEVKRLSEICDMKSGNSITSEDIDDHSEFPCFGGNGLRGRTTAYTHEGRYALIGRQGALCGNILVVDGRFFASEHAIVVTPNKATDVDWLALSLIDMNLNQYSESSAQPGLSVSKILQMTVLAPPFEEQAAIAAILSDMDTEITALETRRDKTRTLKQGMMQELLTGRIRLNVGK